ncbi:MAG: response regulator [Candidatus Saccharicenans sp.]|nr:response regulator [Candidatus Saccharicenans sp.]HOP60647.1 response regulator [Candidatus Saccharicenans sp.]HPB59574.1 response regulator [Candidatus Saccharicenans sp.]HPU92697.1 response regulator [Candidatus Saccharicenans sp.]HQO76498.1 response regulator [Candidatus Saccharicenans sp.]
MPEKKILVVDYDQASLESLTRILKDLKVQVIQATDGAQAYDLFKEEKPDLVILEAILPKLHGFDLTKKISQESKGTVPVIIITGLYKGPQYKHEAMTNLGASEYLEKPVNPEVLLEAVNRLLAAEEDIEDVLPDLETVIALVSTRGK